MPSPISQYITSLFTHVAVCNAIDKLYRDFLWDSSEDQKKFHGLQWSVVCTPKKLGDLGIRKVKDMNCAPLYKWMWIFSHNNEGLWQKLWLVNMVTINEAGIFNHQFNHMDVELEEISGMWQSQFFGSTFNSNLGWTQFLCSGKTSCLKRSLSQSFPLIFQLCSKQDGSSVNLMWLILILLVGIST